MDCDRRIKNRREEVIDESGGYVSPLDDDYAFYKEECDRRNNPLDDDYVREGYE